MFFIKTGTYVFASNGKRNVAVGWVINIHQGTDGILYVIGGNPKSKKPQEIIGAYTRVRRITREQGNRWCRKFKRMRDKTSTFDQIWQHLIELKKSRSSSR